MSFLNIIHDIASFIKEHWALFIPVFLFMYSFYFNRIGGDEKIIKIKRIRAITPD